MQNSKLFAAAALSAALFSAPAAHAGAVFDWNFGTTAAGTFTTGGPASQSGFFLLTDFTITSFVDQSLGSLAVVGVEGNSPSDFAPDASFDPTTGAFENNNGFFNDPGTIQLGGTINGKLVQDIEGGAFAPDFHVLIIDFVDQTILEELVPAVSVTAVAAVPEPMTLSLFGAGLGLLALRRRTAKGV